MFGTGAWTLWGPLLTFGVVGLLALLLRWAFSRGHSLVAGPPRRGRLGEYGLLVSVAAPGTLAEAQAIAQRLRRSGVQATAASTDDGPQVLVFEQDRQQARRMLSP